MAGGLPRGLPPVGAGGSGVQDNRTRWVSDHGDDDLALGPAAFDVGEGLRGLVEGIRPVEDGAEDVGLDELGDLVELRTAGAHEQERVPHALAAGRSAAIVTLVSVRAL